MADDRVYRMWLVYEPDQERFKARVPELDLEVDASSRAEAVEALETAIEARVEDAATSGETLPPALDGIAEPLSVTVDLQGPLAQSLRFLAREQGMQPEALAAQLVAHGLGRLEGHRERSMRIPESDGREAPRDDGESENRGHGHNRGRGRGRGKGRGRREGYRPDIEDQASFLAYVRDMEKGGGGRR